MANQKRHKIRNLLMKMNDDDRQQLVGLLVKSGYVVKIGKERPGGKGQTMYYVEYWEEEDNAKEPSNATNRENG